MTSSPAVTTLTKENFAEVVDNSPFTIVDFWAPWCAPCRMFAPIFEAAALKHPDIRFCKVNTQDEQEIAAEFNIRSIPTLMIFRDNVIVFAQPGALPPAALEDVINQAKALDMEDVKRQIASQDQSAEG